MTRPGKPTRRKDGIAGWRAKFDTQGNETERAFFDEARKPTRSRDGIAGWRSKFDERSNETERAFFDERDSQTKLVYFDETGNPVSR